jgi:hypothetical protein
MGSSGNRTPLGWAMYDYEGALETLVAESNYYRMGKAIRRRWELELAEHGASLQVPEPEEPQRRVIKMDAAARLAYRRVQRLQLAIESALNEPTIEEDVKLVFTPLAARITQHVMREALVMALGAGYRTVTGDMITDAANRIIPWRIAHTADALLQRADEIAMENVARAAVENPRLDSRTPSDMVLRALAQLALKEPSKMSEGFTRGQIAAKVRDSIPNKAGRNGVGNLVRRILDELAASENSGVTSIAGGVNPVTGEQQLKYAITGEAVARADR